MFPVYFVFQLFVLSFVFWLILPISIPNLSVGRYKGVRQYLASLPTDTHLSMAGTDSQLHSALPSVLDCCIDASSHEQSVTHDSMTDPMACIHSHISSLGAILDTFLAAILDTSTRLVSPLT